MEGFIPFGNRVIIELDKKEWEDRKSIVRPQWFDNGEYRQLDNGVPGTVVVLGPRAKELKVGQRVVIPHLQGEVFKHKEKDYQTISESEVLGVLEAA